MSGSAEVRSRLEAAGFELPAGPRALGEYVPAVRAGSLVFTSGQLPMRDGALMATGALLEGADLTAAREAAARAALNALAAASTVCDLDDVVAVVKLTGYVASAPGFTSHPSVVDGASGVMLAAFGEAGKHARAAVGVAALPLGSTVEIEVVLHLV
jgi:enamine deaminase RidA (YjgF/YER057c/UK114 family)